MDSTATFFPFNLEQIPSPTQYSEVSVTNGLGFHSFWEETYSLDMQVLVCLESENWNLEMSYNGNII